MKAMLKAVSKIVFSRTLIIILILLAQIAIMAVPFLYLRNYFPAILETVSVLGVIMLIIIINRDEPAEFKLTWAILICIAPVLGTMVYIFVQNNTGMIGLKKRMDKQQKASWKHFYTSEGTRKALRRESMSFQGFTHFLENSCKFPVYHNTYTQYFPTGEEYIEKLKEDLLSAKRYIFIEYFIIDRGKVWDSVLEILKQKVQEGVEVRVMYDGFCSVLLLPYKYPKKLKEFGIEAKMFAPIVPFLSTTQNSRDHRKIVVIDGKVGYTGGVNLADEYVNLKVRFGHWKDGGIRIEGRAVMSFLLMFIQMWNLYGKENLDFDKYVHIEEDREYQEHDGFVIPYGDTPTTDTEIAKTVYEAIFTHACEYIHIMTPYFVVDREFLSIMRYAAERGIDIRIILPHIPDKKIAFYIAQTYYKELLKSGIRVYEYTPGFVHSKLMVADDRMGTVGSVNLDYRSFYHHFECGVYLYENSAIKSMEKDFNDTLEECIEVTVDYYKSIKWYQKVIGRVFRLIAPLM